MLRQQLRGVLPNILEECLARSKSECKGFLREQLERLPKAFEDTLTETFKGGFDRPTLFTSSPTRNKRQTLNPTATSSHGEASGKMEDLHRECKTQPRWQSKSSLWNRKFWVYRWPIGLLRIYIAQRKRTDIRAGGQMREFEAIVDFKPRLWLFSRGINLAVSYMTDQRGQPTIAPTISTFAVVSGDAPQFLYAMRSRVDELQVLFSQGLAAPTDQMEDGYTLIHVRFNHSIALAMHWSIGATLVVQRYHYLHCYRSQRSGANPPCANSSCLMELTH
jgi:hypothetical protein